MNRSTMLLIGAFAAQLLSSCAGRHDAEPLDTAGSGGAPPLGAAGRTSVSRGGAGAAGASAAGASASAGQAGAAGAFQGCDAASVADLALLFQAIWDPLGYPPYASEGCTLVYVASGSDAGALHVRDLATGEDTALEVAASAPRRPSISGPVIAWEADGVAGSEVHVRYDGEVKAVSGSFDHAGEPRASNDAVVFTAFLGADPNSDSDVYLYEVATGRLSAIADGPGQQRFADVSATHVAITDFSEDPKGYFDEAGSVSDIALIARTTGLRTDRKAPGKQAFPLLGSHGVFAYLEWGAVHPEPKFSQFWLKAGYIDRPLSEDFKVKAAQVSTNPAYVRPSLHGVNLDFIDEGATGAELYRAALDAPGALVPIQIPGAQRLFGPVAAEKFTLLATQLSPKGLTLMAVAR